MDFSEINVKLKKMWDSIKCIKQGKIKKKKLYTCTYSETHNNVYTHKIRKKENNGY